MRGSAISGATSTISHPIEKVSVSYSDHRRSRNSSALRALSSPDLCRTGAANASPRDRRGPADARRAPPTAVGGGGCPLGGTVLRGPTSGHPPPPPRRSAVHAVPTSPLAKHFTKRRIILTM